MLYVTQENVENCWEVLDKLVRDYYATTVASDDLPPLDWNWPMFVELQAQRALVLIVCREEGLIVGFLIYFVAYHPHHQRVLCAQCDTLATRVDRRGKGIGKKLIEFGEKLLKARGVQMVAHNYRTCYDAEPLFPKIGYKLEEHSYRKML
jgi:GNAT superfamily N-acetyltransferase